MASAEKPQILLLSLAHLDFFEGHYAKFLDRLFKFAHVKHVKTTSAALRTIASTTFKAIIIADEGLSARNKETREVLARIKAYVVEDGGLAIAALHFSCFMSDNDKFRNFFRAFGLPWKVGAYYSATFQLNPSCLLPEGTEKSSLPGPYSMKALHVANAEPQQKILVPVDDEDAVTQSLVFSPMNMDKVRAGFVGAKLGRGYLAYCGDFGEADGSIQLILALCGF